MVGQSRGKAEPHRAEVLRCVHPEQVPRGPEKGGQGGVQRGADLWAGQGRWKSEGGDPTKTEAPAAPAAQETKSDGAPASDSKPSSTEAAPSSKETPAATEAPSSTPKAQAPAAPADEVKPAETPAANSDQTVAVKE